MGKSGKMFFDDGMELINL